MCTFDVPGALTPGCWAERSDGWMLLIESVEASRVRYFVLKNSVAYRDEMPEEEFREEFTWKPALDKNGDYEEEELVWIWHSKWPFPISSATFDN